MRLGKRRVEQLPRREMAMTQEKEARVRAEKNDLIDPRVRVRHKTRRIRN